MRRLSEVVIMAGIFAAGCASITAMPKQLQPRTAVVVTSDRFSGTTSVTGIDSILPGQIFSRYMLRSWVQRDSTPTHQLYVTDYYDGDWKFFENANGEDARPLEFTEIGHDVVSCAGGEFRGCSLHETFGAALPDSLLRARAATGYAVKFYAKSGDTLVVRLTPRQIGAELAAVDSVRRADGP